MQINTLEELRQFVADHHVPTDRMRVFLGVRMQEPKCFYLYQDEATGEWVVAKNKDNGETAERYRGPDEAQACQILFEKMKELQQQRVRANAARASQPAPARKAVQTLQMVAAVVMVVVIVAVALLLVFGSGGGSGYYTYHDTHYYLQDDIWYAWDEAAYDWYACDDVDDDFAENYGEYYDGSDYADDADYTSFADSAYYDAESDDDWSSSWSDDDSAWDDSSADTDWSSDW